MDNIANIKNIELSQIKDCRQWNIHPYLSSAPPDILAQSISEVGILQPPTLIDNDSTGYTLLCGRKRLRYIKESGHQTKCFCRILPAVTTPLQILHHILTDQVTSGPLTLPETAFFLKICREQLTKQEVIDYFFEKLHLKKRLSVLHSLLEIVDFDDLILKNIHNSILSDKIIFDLYQLHEDDHRTLNELFQHLHFSASKQKRFFSMCKDCSLRSGESISSFLDDEEFQSIIHHDEMNPPQKVTTLLSLLQRRWLPLHGQAEEEFKKEVQQMQIPAECNISHSPAFEKDEVILTTRFKNLESCKKFLPVLQIFLKEN